MDDMELELRGVAVEPEQELEQIAVEIETITTGAYVMIGQRLIRAQELHRYESGSGGFEGWIERRLMISKRTAYRLIEIAEKIGGNRANLARISIASLAEIARSDEDIRGMLLARIDAGEIFTAERVREIREETKRAAEEAVRVEAGKRMEEAINQMAAAHARIEELETSEADQSEEITDLQARIAEYEQMVAAAKSKLPTPAEAVAIAKETGGGVLGQDGKYHYAEAPNMEVRRSVAAYAALNSTLMRWTDTPDPPAVIVAGTPDRQALAVKVNNAIAYLNTIAGELSK